MIVLLYPLLEVGYVSAPSFCGEEDLDPISKHLLPPTPPIVFS